MSSVEYVPTRAQRMESAAIEGERRLCMLVVSNWSAHALADQPSHLREDLSPFDVVMLIEGDEAYCIYSKLDLFQLPD